MAQSPLLLTFSAYNSTPFSGNLNLFCTTEVSSLILLPFSPTPHRIPKRKNQSKPNHSQRLQTSTLHKRRKIKGGRKICHQTENVLGASGSDDDLGAHGRNPNLDAGVSILGELPGQDLVELGEEDSVSHKLHDQVNPKPRSTKPTSRRPAKA